MAVVSRFRKRDHRDDEHEIKAWLLTDSIIICTHTRIRSKIMKMNDSEKRLVQRDETDDLFCVSV